ncbi:MAG: 4-alpha-glucanotransferase [Candidatus Omnitrophica bacterium]|nr:4-alpha-glucanotransferase [Candidatus Omnitrophota bacterium]
MDRQSGILLHITSLPSRYGIGDLGPNAYEFADFLADHKQSFWQVLPLNLTDTMFGNSPYSSISAFAGNTLLISPDFLVQEGLLTEEDVKTHHEFSDVHVDYHLVTKFKEHLFDCAYAAFVRKGERAAFDLFCNEHKFWLDDYALFAALKDQGNTNIWHDWDLKIRDRDPEEISVVRESLIDVIDKIKFLQYAFFKQWYALKKYCNDKDIKIIGDIPIYVSMDSVDTWTFPHIFKLDKDKKPIAIAGVPPDYFSATGQLWGNPVFDWEALKQENFAWWIRRLEHNLDLFDIVRIDHFRGFAAYWEVPAKETTAVKGKWVGVPGKEFFEAVKKHFYTLPFIAEDLGVITPDVTELMNQFGLPGMKVLSFAFGDNPVATSPYAPHNHIQHCVVYTGTHDNNTILGWFNEEATKEMKAKLFKYLGRSITADEVVGEFLRIALSSVARVVILPMQDILGLGSEARMNIPGRGSHNWQWRLLTEQLRSDMIAKFTKLTETYGRG